MTHIQVKRSEYELWFKSLVSASERQQKPEEEPKEEIIYKAIYDFKNQWTAKHVFDRIFGVGGIKVWIDGCTLWFESEKDWFSKGSEGFRICKLAGGRKRVTSILREQNQI